MKLDSEQQCNQKIIDYDTIEEIHLGRLEQSVVEGIAKGWQPIGGVSVINETEHQFGRFVQTMVYYEEK